MSLTAWVATHTGLPSFYAVGTGRLTADVVRFGTVVGERLVAKVSGAALVSDAGAGAGVATTYRFGSASAVLTRRGKASTDGGDPLSQWVSTADGDTIADVALLGDDPRDHDTSATVFVGSTGARIPRYPLATPSETGTLELSTHGVGTETLRRLVDEKAPLWVVHNEAACQIKDCDIEGARLVVPQSLNEVRSGRRDRATRLWQVAYTRVPDSLGNLAGDTERASAVPVVTWGQWANWGKKNSFAGWQDWSALQVATRVAGMP